VAYGYRYGEIELLLAPKKPKPETNFTRIDESPLHRRPVAVSLGPVISVAALPHPDMSDTTTIVAGVQKRAGSVHPTPDQKLLAELEIFVLEWLKKYLTPLSPDCDVSVERWLAHTNYPEWRKLELLDKYYKVINQFDPKYAKAKCFVKDEPYVEYKHARGIYSRTDEFKCFVGPFFKLIEEEVYKLPEFIKHVPVAERPRYISEKLDGEGSPQSTDYTSFESQFSTKIMQIVEMQLYKYMTQYLPGYNDFLRHLNVIANQQFCSFKYVDVKLDTCRLSGEMCTSLGNGFSNLMFALFTAHRKGCSNVRIVVEGDDGLMKYDGPTLLAEDFAQIGLTIKMETHSRIETASFCGIIFDSEELINIDDPRDNLATFGWGNSRYVQSRQSKLKALLRCKALSLAHQYPGCPIVSELAHYGLRATRGIRIGKVLDSMNNYQREQVLAAIKDERKIQYKQPGPRSRDLVEHMYGITIEVQLKIEQYLREKQDLSPLNCEWITSIMPEIWRHYSMEYVRYVNPSYITHESFKEVNSLPLLRELLSGVKHSKPKWLYGS
jgi:hypothetical protein